MRFSLQAFVELCVHGPMSNRIVGIAALWAISVQFVGCAYGPAVVGPSELPVRRIVIYRNGVSYIERSGVFDGSVLSFGVRGEDVDDFLTSLTAVESGHGTVHSVAFSPLEPVTSHDGDRVEANDRVQVKLHFSEDASHDLAVSYVVGAPIWRPAYRVVAGGGDEVLLQAWAVVQNTSGEDWRDVELSLTTGAPIALRSDLGTPFTPPRPLVTDSGEVISVVPESQTVLDQGGDEGAVHEDVAEEMDASFAKELNREMASSSAQVKRGRALHGIGTSPRPSSAAGGSSVQTVASTKVQTGGVTRYDLDGLVTIPDRSSTMVAVLSRSVPGTRAYLYAPEPGVPGSLQHPFSAVRFTNVTGAHLERGPISVYGEGNFLGQGVLSSLAPDATTFIPFATERGMVVRSSITSVESEGRLVRFDRGRITVERFLQRKTLYDVQNGTGGEAVLYVRHARYGAANVVEPPEGTEVTAQHLLVPIQVGAKSEAAYEVVEQTPVSRNVEFISDVGATAVALYLRGPAVDAASGPVLTEALALRQRWLDLQARSRGLRKQRHLLRESSADTRENLKSIKAVPRAKQLRKRLTLRLSELDTQVAVLTGQVIEADEESSELKVRIAELLRGVSLKPAVSL